MSLIHPAFSAIEDLEIGEALSAPFMRPNEYTVFNEDTVSDKQYMIDPKETIPLVLGGVVLHGEDVRFAIGISQHSTTPLNHTAGYLDHYGDQIGRARAPMFDNQVADGPSGLDMIASMQEDIIRIALEDRLKVVSGFMLGLVGEPQTIIAGLIVSKRALEVLHQGIEEGFGMAESVFEKAYSEEAEDYGGRESMREDLLDTAKRHSIPCSVGRLLPTRQTVSTALIEASPQLEEFYAKTRKAQSKVLRAERIAANNFN